MSGDPPPSSPSSRPLRILLAEDDVINQTLVVLLLAQQQHAVTVVADGRQALAALEQHSFDVVLMDVQMPELDGFATTDAIRTREQGTGRHTQIIAMTAHTNPEDQQLCLRAGMDAYLAKPIQPADLFAALAKVAPVYDRAVLLKRVRGNENNLRQLVSIFQDESVKLLAQIQAAIAGRQAAPLRRAAHSLKGAVGIFGATAAEQTAQLLEEMGRTETFTDADEAAERLTRQLDQLRIALAEMVTPAPG